MTSKTMTYKNMISKKMAPENFSLGDSTMPRATHLPCQGIPRLATRARRLAYGLSLVLGIAVLTGCAANPGQGLPPYGDSVRHMKQAQTYQPGDEVPALSGDKAARAMETYRQPTRQGGGVGQGQGQGTTMIMP